MPALGLNMDVRWSEEYLRKLNIEPKPERPIGFITKDDIRAGELCYEVCFESDRGTAYVLASADMLESVNA